MGQRPSGKPGKLPAQVGADTEKGTDRGSWGVGEPGGGGGVEDREGGLVKRRGERGRWLGAKAPSPRLPLTSCAGHCRT